MLSVTLHWRRGGKPFSLWRRYQNHFIFPAHHLTEWSCRAVELCSVTAPQPVLTFGAAGYRSVCWSIKRIWMLTTVYTYHHNGARLSQLHLLFAAAWCIHTLPLWSSELFSTVLLSQLWAPASHGWKRDLNVWFSTWRAFYPQSCFVSFILVIRNKRLSDPHRWIMKP